MGRQVGGTFVQEAAVSSRSFKQEGAPLFRTLLAFVFGFAGVAAGQTCVSLTAAGSAYTQDFNTLASTGTSSTVPAGWAFSEAGTNANGTYTAGTGSSNAGDTYSFGAAGSTERAFGTLQSGALIPTIGACFTNNTGSAITSLAVAYTGEEWRLGTAGRTDQLNFEYSMDASSLTTGTWTGVAALNFTTPDEGGTVGARDGNAAGERTAIRSTITGLGIANETTFWIRWTDFNAAGADDGLAVDDFSLTPNGGGGGSNPTASGSATPNPVVAGNATTLAATVTGGTNPGSESFTVTCNLTALGGSSSFGLAGVGPVFSNPYAVPANAGATTYSLPCGVTDDQARTGNFSIALTVQAPPPAFKRIYEITGSGTSSPLAGVAVSTRGIVTALRGTSGSTKGFYLESTAADQDSDPDTSEGLLVFVGSAPLPSCAAVGNMVQIDGTVQDFVPSTSPVGSVALTELSSTSNCQVLSPGNALPAPVVLTTTNLASGGNANQARKFLGMLVTMPSAEVVGPSLGNLNESTATATPSGQFFVTLAGVNRPFHGAGILDTRRPSDAAGTVPVWNGNPEAMRIDTMGLTGGTTFEITPGSTIAGITGVMDFNTSQSQYQIYTNAAGLGTITAATLAATPVPAAPANDVTVANFNIERFFNDQNEGNGNNVTLTTAAYQGRLNKLSLAVRNVLGMPDILTLEEVEGPKPGDPQVYPVVQDIVNKINGDAVAAGQGNPDYGWCQYPTNDVGEISPAILYKQGKVALLDCVQYGLNTTYNTPGGGSALLNDRPPVVLRANVTAPGSDTGVTIRVVGNHLRSLGGIDEPGVANGDRVRAKRNEQAKYVANLVTGNLAEQTANWNLTDNLLVAGDMNAFEVNDGYGDTLNCIGGAPAAASQVYTTGAQAAVSPACAVVATLALTNLTTTDPAQRYSYSFSGTAQRIDHILVNEKLLGRVRQFAYARNDADFPEGPTYRNDFTRPERLSDHDMPVVYLTLPVEVTSRTRVNASALVLNRLTQRYSGTISVTNTGTAALNGPIFVFFDSLPGGVTLPDLPQYGGVPYTTVNVPLGLAPGATSGTVNIRFADPSNVRIGYTTRCFDGSF